MPLWQFLDEYNYKKAVHIEGNNIKFDGLFDWNSLNDELAVRSLNSLPIKISTGGDAFSTSDARLVQKHAKAGATIILENIDNTNGPLRNFLNAFSDEICTSTRINLYLSFPGKQGYDIHYDTHDFFILQIEGCKEWHVYPPTVTSPLFFQKTHGDAKPTQTEMYLQCTMHKGDVLYVPTGHWHDAISVDQPSLHLTLAMFTPTGVDFLNWFVDELRDDSEIRRTLPFVLKTELPDTNEPVEKVRQALDEIIRLVKVKLSNQSLESDFRRYLVAKRKNRIPFSFPDQFLALPLAGQYRRVPHSTLLQRNGQDELELLYAGKIARFKSHSKELLDFVLSRDFFSMSELMEHRGSLTREEVGKIVSLLTNEGLIVSADVNRNQWP
jgi:ribosomal protein L16 Arg81 hydroxylase